MSDNEYEKFEISDYDLENEFNPNRNRRRPTKNQQIYGTYFLFPIDFYLQFINLFFALFRQAFGLTMTVTTMHPKQVAVAASVALVSVRAAENTAKTIRLR